MPAFLAALFLIGEVKELAFVQLFELYRADDTNLFIFPAISTTGIQHGMDVES